MRCSISIIKGCYFLWLGVSSLWQKNARQTDMWLFKVWRRCGNFSMSDRTERPIAFASRVLSPAQQNYSATHKEALVIYFDVKGFSHYLLDRRFTLQATIHWFLFMEPTRGIPRPHGWSVYQSNFGFTIQYIPGKCNLCEALIIWFFLTNGFEKLVENSNTTRSKNGSNIV